MLVWLPLILLIAIPLLHFFCIAPNRRRLMPDNPLCGVCYAHRGLHSQRNRVPENSLQSFAFAASRGYGIELDVRLSADGEVVVFHDDTLARMTDDPRQVDALTYEELSALRLNDTEHTIPLFSRALEEVAGRVPLMVELKPVKNRELLCSRVCELLEDYEGPFCVQSFDPLILLWFRRNAPDILRGQLSGNIRLSDPATNPILAWLLTNLYTNVLSRPHFISYDGNFFGNSRLRTLRVRHNTACAAWTVDSLNDYENLSRYSQMIIFENILPPVRFHDPRDRVTRRDSSPAGGRRK